MSRVKSLIAGLVVGTILSALIWRGVGWYEGNIVQAEPSEAPCWDANAMVAQREAFFIEYDNRDPDDDPAPREFSLFHCTDDGEYWTTGR